MSWSPPNKKPSKIVLMPLVHFLDLRNKHKLYTPFSLHKNDFTITWGWVFGMNKTIKMDAMDLMEILVIICDMIDLCGLSQPAILSIRRIKQILVRNEVNDIDRLSFSKPCEALRDCFLQNNTSENFYQFIILAKWLKIFRQA